MYYLQNKAGLVILTAASTIASILIFLSQWIDRFLCSAPWAPGWAAQLRHKVLIIDEVS